MKSIMNETTQTTEESKAPTHTKNPVTGELVANNAPIPPEYYSDIQMRINELTGKSDFVGSFLQVISVSFSRQIPTAAVCTTPKERSIKLLFNPEFYKSLSIPERVAVLKHEVLHVVFKHIFQFKHVNKLEHRIYNVAMDMVINQFIEDLPKMCIDRKNFRTKDGKIFPENLTVEGYLELLMKDGSQSKDPETGEWKDIPKKFVKQPGKGIKGEGEGADSHDSHDWDDCDDEIIADKVKAAKNKHEKSFSKCPDYVDDFLNSYYKKIKDINYKQILKQFISTRMPSLNYTNTWTRPSKRYGMVSQGTKTKPNPTVEFYGDTSGSIGKEELNEFLSIMCDIFTVGVKETKLNLFHTSVYHTQKFKRNSRIEKIQSGGTDLTDVFRSIHKNAPDLALIYTDGYYDVPAFTKKNPKTKVIFIIRNDQNVKHPASHLGDTIVYKKP